MIKSSTKSPLSSLTKTRLQTYITIGRSYAAIAKKYKVTRQAVFQKVIALGLGGLRSSLLDKRNKKIIKMYDRKIPTKQISETFGLSVAQVCLIVRTSRTEIPHVTAKKK